MMSLFLSLSSISLGRYYRKNVFKGGGFGKKDEKGRMAICSVICKMMASLYTIKIALLRNRLLSLINHHSTDSHFGSVKRYFVWHSRKVGPCPWTPERLGPPGPPENPGPLVS